MSAIGLVTVLYKSEEVLEGFFKSLSRQTFQDFTLYLIDNDPSEKVRALLTDTLQRFPLANVVHLENNQNAGVAKGNNQGIERSIGDGCTYTLLLNNDIEFEQPDLLERMWVRATSQGEHLMIPKIYYYDSRLIWMAGGGFDRAKGTVYHVGDNQPDKPAFNVSTYFEYAPTCFMLVNNDVFKSVGLMDESYFVYYDDADFIFRAVKQGYRIFYLPEAQVYHKVSSSTGGKESVFSIYYTTRNRLYFVRKNFTWLPRLIAICYTLATRTFRWFIYDKQQANALREAIREGFRMPIPW